MLSFPLFKTEQSVSKIFCIGLSKTGTTSLTKALSILGYRSFHFPWTMLRYQNGRLSVVEEKVRPYDALSDIPVARFYQELDCLFPGSKFILTVRNQDAWLDSCERHFWPGQILKGENWINQLHRDIYGSIDFDRERFYRAYQAHKREVRDYFAERPQDLLLMDLARGDGWEKLCAFLDKPLPEQPFPKRDCLYTNVFKVVNMQRFRSGAWS